jgi:hypothetical protein
VFLLKGISSDRLDLVPCERIGTQGWGEVEKVNSCVLQKTSFDTRGRVVFSPFQEELPAIDFYKNKNVYFLPIKTHGKFPNVQRIHAGRCSIIELSEANFEKLFKLEYLWLDNNQIETLPEGVFRDLKSLRVISLGEFAKIQCSGGSRQGHFNF